MNITDSLHAATKAVNLIDLAKEYGFRLTKEFRSPCPEGHDDLTLQFDPEAQSFYCVHPTCRLHGSAIDLVQLKEHVLLRDAVNILSKKGDLRFLREPDWSQEETVDQVRRCLQAAVRIYARNLDSVMPYLESRGISRATAERYLLGGCLGKDGLKRALLAEGFSEGTVGMAGLLNQFGDDFFRDRVVIPIRVNGQVVNLYGRALRPDDEVAHLRMSNERMIIGEGIFNWNPRRREIIAVEGILDALALIDGGFTGAVSTFGTQGFSSPKTERWLVDSNVRKVWVCYDGDESGRDAALRDAYALNDQSIEALIVDIDEQDPNEYMLTHTPADFQERLSKAVSPVQKEIDSIDPDLPLDPKIIAFEPLLRRAKQMKPLAQESVVKSASEVLGLSRQKILEHIAALAAARDPQIQLVELSDCDAIHPALDMVGDTLLMGISEPRLNADVHAVVMLPFIVTSKREFFRLDAVELQKRGYYTRSYSVADEPRYTAATVKHFVNGHLSGDLVRAFRQVNQLLERNVDFADRNTYAMLTLWVMGTYMFPIFNYFPYLHFTGTKNVGKSKTMKLMSCICFNGTMSVSVTAASQFRIIEAFRPTLFLDESEDLRNRGFSDKRALLLGGYEAGSSVLRAEKVGETYAVKRLSNYSPRAFASIEGLEDTLASRTVQITMQRSFDKDIKETEVSLSDPVFQDTRDELFLAAMTFAPLVKNLYARITRPDEMEFGDREFNLFKPILAIARATGIAGLEKAIMDFANTSYRNKIAEYNTSAPENVLLQYLLEVITQDGWQRSDSLHAGFVNYIKTNGMDLNMRITKAFMGSLVKKLGIVSDTRRASDRTCTLYFIKVDVLKRVAENYQVI